MKHLLRMFLLAAVTIIIAVPASAQCGRCTDGVRCDLFQGAGYFCMQYIDYCEEWPSSCFGSTAADPAALSTELTIASVVIETPAGTVVTERHAEPVRTASLNSEVTK